MKEIQLAGHRKGSSIKGYAIIDDENFEKVNQYKWHLTSHGYASTNLPHKNHGKPTIYLHHLIMGTHKNKYIDHINRNKLDNRLENLRIVTPQQSSWNIHKSNKNLYRGVTYIKGRRNPRKNPYMASIGSKNIFIGYLDNPLHAAIAYDIWAKEWYGQYAPLNFPTAISGYTVDN